MFLMDFSHGFAREVLGCSVLTLGVFLLFNTDEFLFGPVELSSSEATSAVRIVTKLWNNNLAGSDEESNDLRRTRKRIGRWSIENSNMVVIWSIVSLTIANGLFHLNNIRLSAGENYDIRFLMSTVRFPTNLVTSQPICSKAKF